MLEPGDILDHYRLEAAAARSGMGVLYRAADLNTGRTVAVKIPHPEMEADPVLLERFRREQEIGQTLDHPGIVKTFNSEQRSRHYMVLEWVDGRLLRTLLNQEQPFPPQRAVAIAMELCDALDAMHKHGVVHRDLKPENIMVSDGDRVKIIDFGIAMKEDARRITHAGVTPMLGTPDYISPEQVQGKRGDQRSDIYALGIMLYEMLTGRVPFAGPNPLAVMNERLLIRSAARAGTEPGDFAPVGGNPAPRPGARPAVSLRHRGRDAMGPGTPGTGRSGRGRHNHGAPWRQGAVAQTHQPPHSALRLPGPGSPGHLRADAGAGPPVRRTVKVDESVPVFRFR